MKTLPALVVVLLRAFQGAFLFAFAALALLAYVPFTYHQIHQGNLFPAVTAFVGLCGWLWWPLMALGALPVVFGLGWRRAETLAYLAAHAVAGVLLVMRPFPAQLASPGLALAWSLGAFASLAWTGRLDWRVAAGASGGAMWPARAKGGATRLFLAAVTAAASLAVSYGVAAWLRLAGGTRPGPSELVYSLDAHLAVFLGLFAALTLASSLGEASLQPTRTEFLIVAALAASGGIALMAGMLFPVISFSGPLALCVAAFLAVTGTLFWSGVAVRLHVSGIAPAQGGLGLFVLPLEFWMRRLWRPARVIAVAAALAGLTLATVSAAAMDWNYLGQKTTAMVGWVVVFALLFGTFRNARRDATLWLALASVAALGAHRLLASGRTPLPAASGEALANYANFNGSFKVIYDWTAAPEGSRSYYRYLAANTNLPRERQIAPVEVRLSGQVERQAAAPGPRPNIFIIVIDSLRRDYLEPYNPAVSFTPAIAAFAGESIVARQAYTRYGGTGLSEPSIWAGALLPHKQYVTPFHPMNNLEKLIESCGYRSYISFDTILATLLHREENSINIDEGVQTMNLDLARSLGQLEQILASRGASGVPLFAYTQPQNLHISVINRAGRSVPAGESYPGFDAAYASRLKRVDAAFGGFIAFLKREKLYESSVVVLTADHGDSLGEDGRWGHAYSLVPEVVRIPLILHVPEELKRGRAWEEREPTFLTDITPTLYELLGQGPVTIGGVLGKPLEAATAADLARYRRENWLVASSYAPVYGILHRGLDLYVSDAVQYREFLYDMREARPLARTPAEGARNSYQETIRRHIEEIAGFYKTEGAAPAPRVAASGGAAGAR